MWIFKKKTELDEALVDCSVCENLRGTEDGAVICAKKGRVSDVKKCRSFSYDITKKVPKRHLRIEEYEE